MTWFRFLEAIDDAVSKLSRNTAELRDELSDENTDNATTMKRCSSTTSSEAQSKHDHQKIGFALPEVKLKTFVDNELCLQTAGSNTGMVSGQITASNRVGSYSLTTADSVGGSCVDFASTQPPNSILTQNLPFIESPPIFESNSTKQCFISKLAARQKLEPESLPLIPHLSTQTEESNSSLAISSNIQSNENVHMLHGASSGESDMFLGSAVGHFTDTITHRNPLSSDNSAISMQESAFARSAMLQAQNISAHLPIKYDSSMALSDAGFQSSTTHQSNILHIDGMQQGKSNRLCQERLFSKATLVDSTRSELTSTTTGKNAHSSKASINQPSPLPGRTVPRKPRNQRVLLLSDAENPNIINCQSPLQTLISSNSISCQESQDIDRHNSDKPTNHVANIEIQSTFSDQTKDTVVFEKEETNLNPVHPLNDSCEAILSTTPSIGSVLEYDNENFYDSEAELDDSVDAESITSLSLQEMENDAAIPIVRNPELDLWSSGEMVSHSLEHDSDFNCHGVVHVRFCKAYNLPCSENTLIQPILSLPPWKGCIRTERAVATHSSKRGIYVKWNQCQHAEDDESGDLSDLSVALGNFGTEFNIVDDDHDLISIKEGDASMKSSSQYYPMVHDYNNEDTPIPFVFLELVSISLFETTIASVKISCRTIMKNPGKIHRRWFVMSLPDLTLPEEANHVAEKDESDLDSLVRFKYLNEPSILLDLWFEPSSVIKTTGSQFPDLGYAKAHLFRIRSYWAPAYCSLCSALLTLKGGYRCEKSSCSLDCCADCLLSIDVRLPCGSLDARRVVENSVQSKMAIGRLLQVVAPLGNRETTSKSTTNVADQGPIPQQAQHESIMTQDTSMSIIDASKEIISGIGILKLRIERAVLFRDKYAPEAYLEDILSTSNLETKEGGDHYVRVSWDNGKECIRTRTVHQTAKPNFADEGQMDLHVSDYGAEFKIEVIDANSDKPAGWYLLSVHEVLQTQYDAIATDPNLHLEHLYDARKIPVELKKKIVELRSGLKGGFGLDFFSSDSKGDSDRNKSRPGAITGFLEINVCVEEDLALLYSPCPRLAPRRPNREFSVELIQLHIGRLIALIEGFKVFVSTINYYVSWENPLVSAISMVTFVYICLHFNAEYSGSIPFSILFIYMLYKARIRRAGMFQRSWVEQERDSRLEEDKKLKAITSVYRSIAILRVMVTQGRNICSKDLGLPGRYKASAFWRPNKKSSTKEKELLTKLDELYPMYLGSTVTSNLTTNPIWTHIRESEGSSRLKSIILGTQVNGSLDSSSLGRKQKLDDNEDTESLDSLNSEAFDEEMAFIIPILQPVKVGRPYEGPSEVEKDSTTSLEPLPWDSCSGALIIQVISDNVLSKLLVFEDIVGELEIPFTQIFNGLKVNNEERELKGWFPLALSKTTSLSEAAYRLSPNQDVYSHEDFETPEVYVDLRLSLPDSNKRTSTEFSEEMSAAVSDEMLRAASLARINSTSVLGSGISTINTVGGLLGNIQLIQNQMGNILDKIESVMNIFTWAHPHRSFLVFGAIFVLWLSMCIVPTRLVILVGGLVPFVANFISAFVTENVSHVDDVSPEKPSNSNSIINFFLNFIEAIPTNEDLRRIYYWEGRRLGERERQSLAKYKRTTRLKKLWRALWFGTLKIKRVSNHSTKRTSWKWDTVFMVIQGHRIVWWSSIKEFDESEAPESYVLLAGHAGLASLSPLDLRDYGQQEIDRIVTVFGRGPNEQHKVSFLAADASEKSAIEDAVILALSDQKSA